MCGIVGRFHFQGPDPSVALIRGMADTIVHRGPDDEGFFVEGAVGLGMRRLSIIDVAGSKQPITNEDGTVVVVFNGEIYNYRELTAELLKCGHRFKTHGDTETLVHLYEEHGPRFVNLLNGMFAFALWDGRKKMLVIARDRVGIKPLSYFVDRDKLVFGSEIKSILSCGDVSTGPDESVITQYIIKGKYLYNQTFFRNIVHLPAGHILLASSSGIEVQQYWDYRFRRPKNGSADELSRRLLRAIQSSVKDQLMSEVPIGSYLSGGIDSSAVAVAAAKASMNRISTFSAVFPGHPEFNEDEFQQEVVKATGVDHHQNDLSPDAFLEDLKKLIWHIEQPLAGITIGQFQMARFTKQWVTVVLTGHGGDELFGGYPNHLVGAWLDAFRGCWYNPGDWSSLTSDLRAVLGELGPVKFTYNAILFAKPFPSVRKLIVKVYEAASSRGKFTPEFRRRNRGVFTHQVVFDLLKRSNASTYVDRMLYVDVKLWLHNILMVEDKESMAHSLEDRVPLLDNRIIDISEEMPSSQKVRHNVLKHGLRDALAGFLPGDLLGHKKMGFPQPVGEWMRDQRLEEIIVKRITQGDLVGESIVTREFAEKLCADHFERHRDRSFELWQLLCVELWFDQFRQFWRRTSGKVDGQPVEMSNATKGQAQ